MRSKSEIENEIIELQDKIQRYEQDLTDYSGDAAERYLFFTASKGLISGYDSRKKELEDQLAKFDTAKMATGF